VKKIRKTKSVNSLRFTNEDREVAAINKAMENKRQSPSQSPRDVFLTQYNNSVGRQTLDPGRMKVDVMGKLDTLEV